MTVFRPAICWNFIPCSCYWATHNWLLLRNSSLMKTVNEGTELMRLTLVRYRRMKVHLVDGTYELFRHYYAIPKRRTKNKEEVAATVGVLNSMLQLLNETTHIAIATDHIIESFRNNLWPYYKDGSGIERD